MIGADDIEEFKSLMRAAYKASLGDSNDDEIAAWRQAAQFVESLLGLDMEEVSQ